MQRTWLAAAIAPLVPTVVLLALFVFAPLALTWLLLVLTQLLGQPGPGPQDTIYLIMPGPIAILIGSTVDGYVLSYILGVPAGLVLRRLRWTRWYAYFAGGFIAGAVAASLVLLWITFHDSSWPMAEVRLITPLTFISVSIYAIGLVIGVLMAVTGLLFWLIARPDRRLA
jgi:hypothetical protein